MKYEILKKFENLDDEKFISRLDGSEKSKSDYEKRRDFWKPKNTTDGEFEKIIREIGNSFNNEHKIESTLVFYLLKQTWKYDDEFLRKVSEYFESFDYSHLFLNEYDSVKDIEEAWENFTRRILGGDEQPNPFI